MPMLMMLMQGSLIRSDIATEQGNLNVRSCPPVDTERKTLNEIERVLLPTVLQLNGEYGMSVI